MAENRFISSGFEAILEYLIYVSGPNDDCPSKIGIDVTAFSLPILLTSGTFLYLISFQGSFFSPSLSLSIYYDVNRIGKPKAVTSIPIFLGH